MVKGTIEEQIAQLQRRRRAAEEEAPSAASQQQAGESFTYINLDFAWIMKLLHCMC